MKYPLSLRIRFLSVLLIAGTFGLLGASSPAVAGDGAQFISQSVPTSLNTGQTVSVSITMKNTGTNTWFRDGNLGYKLGTQNPQDNTLWTGATRVYLAVGETVAPGAQKTFTFNITAPSSPGTYNFRWRMVHELVAWFGDYTPNVAIQVNKVVTVCPGVNTTIGVGLDNGPAINQCIANTASGGTLAIPAEVYNIGTQIKVSKPMTIRTSGTAGSTQDCESVYIQCATFKALSNYYAFGGIVDVTTTAGGIHLEHLIIDGNRSARLGSAAASKCASGGNNNRYGYNVRMQNCPNCSFKYNVSKNTLCGTALEFRGSGGYITDNVIRANGQNSVSNMWADGVTIHEGSGIDVTDNLFVDNSDVALILGGGSNAFVARNTIQQIGQVVFAGLMLDNFNGGTSGNFTNAVVTQNTVYCGSGSIRNCHFGINLGPHAWYQPPNNIYGGAVHGNTVTNARQGINVDGAGTSSAPLWLYSNTVSGSPTSATFLCGTHQTSNLNIYTAHSVVNRNGDTSPATNFAWHSCP